MKTPWYAPHIPWAIKDLPQNKSLFTNLLGYCSIHHHTCCSGRISHRLTEKLGHPNVISWSTPFSGWRFEQDKNTAKQLDVASYNEHLVILTQNR